MLRLHWHLRASGQRERAQAATEPRPARETTGWATAHKAERVAWSLASPSECSMARQARCNRVHSAVTYRVNVIEARKVNVHAVFLKLSSGQLPFLGYVQRLNHAR